MNKLSISLFLLIPFISYANQDSQSFNPERVKKISVTYTVERNEHSDPKAWKELLDIGIAMKENVSNDATHYLKLAEKFNRAVYTFSGEETKIAGNVRMSMSDINDCKE
jgi:hypothetical protein